MINPLFFIALYYIHYACMCCFPHVKHPRYPCTKHYASEAWLPRSSLLIRTLIRGWVNFLRRKGESMSRWTDEGRKRKREGKRAESKHQRRGSPNKIVVKPASSPARAGLRLRPQINDRDARDKITSRIKERRYVPITSTYLRDRSISPQAPRNAIPLFARLSARTQRGVSDRILPRANREDTFQPRSSNDAAFKVLIMIQFLSFPIAYNFNWYVSPH